MTLIITAINKSNIVQASDRRLTRDGKLEDENANKAICVVYQEGKLGIAYTGLAEVIIAGKCVRTDILVADYLAAINAGSKSLDEITTSLSKYITPIFNNQRLPKLDDKRTTFAFAGFRSGRTFVGGLSNFEDEDGRSISVRSNFSTWVKYLSASDETPCLFMVNGCEDVIDDTFWPSIQKRGKEIAYKPTELIEKELVLFIRWAAHHSKLGKYIGQNCMTTTFSSENGFTTNYHPLNSSPQSYAPHLIAPGMAFRDIEMWSGAAPPWWKKQLRI